MAEKDIQLSSEQEARRRLLKMAAYVPPAILGVMVSANVSEAGAPVLPGQPKVCKGGGTIIVSAGGNACCPCVPTDPKYNPTKCTQKQCKLGNCPACKSTVFKKLSDCTKKPAISACCVCQVYNNAGNPNDPLNGKVLCL